MIEFYTLGTSSAVPTSRRDLSANFLNFQGEKMLFDCGEGAQKTIMRQRLGLMDIDKVFITHWHADHFSGLLGLVQTMGMEGRDRPLYIYGPEGTEEFTQRLLELGYFDRRYEIFVDDMEPGDRVADDDYEVRAFATDHGVPSVGFVFEEDAKRKASHARMEELGLEPSPKIGRLKDGETVEVDGRTIEPDDVIEEMPGRKIVYTGDTEYTESVVKAAADADLLVHDATFSQELVDEGRYGHTSARQAAEVAKAAGVERLVLTHFSRRFDTDTQKLVDEAQEVFGNVEAADEGQKFEVRPHRPEGEG
ncbi:MAG: ribonuclease Z [Candidatus Nanohaloarchaea archaeon]|nr:ribonuclease Z [Candidatus Nanohaloarchaea archaeon]